MHGKKDFINNTGLDLHVILTVRFGERPGCVFRVEEFCLKRGEKKCITFGNECHHLLDGCRAYSNDDGGCTETSLFVLCAGSKIDKLLNRNDEIKFVRAAQSIVISGNHC